MEMWHVHVSHLVSVNLLPVASKQMANGQTLTATIRTKLSENNLDIFFPFLFLFLYPIFITLMKSCASCKDNGCRSVTVSM